MKSVRSPLMKVSTKTPTGIAGFAAVTRGGLPRDRATLLADGPGFGKTILALRFLLGGAQDRREPGISGASPASARQPK